VAFTLPPSSSMTSRPSSQQPGTTCLPSSESRDVSILLGLGDGTFGQQVRYAARKARDSVAVGHFNSDAVQNLAVANSNSDDVSILVGRGNGGGNLPPGVNLANAVASPPEDTETSAGVKVADIVVTDDGVGTKALGLSGPDAALFEVVGDDELHLKVGATFDYETSPVLDVVSDVGVDKSDGTTIGDIVINGSLGTLNARTADPLGDLAATRTIRRIYLDDVPDGHHITIGPADRPIDTVTLRFDRVANLVIDSETPIRSLVATDWQDSDATPDRVETPWMGSLCIRGSRRDGLSGYLTANVALDRVGARPYTLTNARTAGALRSAERTITGEVGSTRADDATGWTLDVNSEVRSLSIEKGHLLGWRLHRGRLDRLPEDHRCPKTGLRITAISPPTMSTATYGLTRASARVSRSSASRTTPSFTTTAGSGSCEPTAKP